jgi:hypothetical protein
MYLTQWWHRSTTGVRFIGVPKFLSPKPGAGYDFSRVWRVSLSPFSPMIKVKDAVAGAGYKISWNVVAEESDDRCFIGPTDQFGQTRYVIFTFYSTQYNTHKHGAISTTELLIWDFLVSKELKSERDGVRRRQEVKDETPKFVKVFKKKT